MVNIRVNKNQNHIFVEVVLNDITKWELNHKILIAKRERDQRDF